MEKIKHNETLADQAYKIIKKAIVNGKLKENEPLPEERLAKNLGISRTPLRDALNRLSVEGLVIQQTGRPAKVASFTKEKSLEYLELRSLLEVYNIEKTISKFDDDLITKLQENLSEQLSAICFYFNIKYIIYYHDFIELDSAFHLLLASRNNNNELKEIIHRMNTGINRAFLILSSTLPASAKEAYVEHKEIVEALENQDVVLARNKMIVHLNNVEKRFLAYYDTDSQ